MSSAKRRGLGRGLDALLATPAKNIAESSSTGTNDNELQHLLIEQLQPGKYQPRKDMSDNALEELSLSIKAQGIIQPIIVRKSSQNNYEIIAGERRWRAAKLAGITTVPCIIKDVADEAAIAIALIENIQREDLNAMEEAVSLQRLLTEFELTHQEVADAVGKSRTTVSNLLRLNNLNEEVKTFLERGDIDMGHARALLALTGDTQTETARTIVAKDLTVRETEVLIKKVQTPVIDKKPAETKESNQVLESDLSEKIGAKVAISHNKKGKGKLVISYANLTELDKIMAKFN